MQDFLEWIFMTEDYLAGKECGVREFFCYVFTEGNNHVNNISSDIHPVIRSKTSLTGDINIFCE